MTERLDEKEAIRRQGLLLNASEVINNFLKKLQEELPPEIREHIKALVLVAQYKQDVNPQPEGHYGAASIHHSGFTQHGGGDADALTVLSTTVTAYLARNAMEEGVKQAILRSLFKDARDNEEEPAPPKH